MKLAVMFSKAQRLLKKADPSFSLQVLDAARQDLLFGLSLNKMIGAHFER